MTLSETITEAFELRKQMECLQGFEQNFTRLVPEIQASAGAVPTDPRKISALLKEYIELVRLQQWFLQELEADFNQWTLSASGVRIGGLASDSQGLHCGENGKLIHLKKVRSLKRWK